MYSPLELEKISFGNSVVGGYKKNDVDEFLTILKKDYEELYKEAMDSRNKISMLEELVNKYKSMEDSLQNALILAQTSSDAAISAANDKAQNIIRDAENRAEVIRKELDDTLRDMRGKQDMLVRSMNIFVSKNVSQLQTQIDILTSLVKENASDNEITGE